MWLEMKVKGLALEPLSNMPMLILGDEEDTRGDNGGNSQGERDTCAHERLLRQ